jgi:hypothetical protein
MRIDEKALRHWIENFYGYGSWDAKIWFIAYEESGGDVPEDVAERINYFAAVHPEKQATLCDIRVLYRKVLARLDGPRADKFKTLYDHRFGKQAVQHGGWKNLIAFAHAYRNKKMPDLLQYQQHSFADVKKANEAFINLYPLPAPHNHAWYYSWLDMPGLSFIRKRNVYEDTVFDNRILTVLKNIQAYKPELVLMFGMNNINRLKKSIQDFFPDAAFTTSKAVKQRTPQFHRADVNGTTLLITTQVPTLRHNRQETGFDWEEFAGTVRPSR